MIFSPHNRPSGNANDIVEKSLETAQEAIADTPARADLNWLSSFLEDGEFGKSMDHLAKPAEVLSSTAAVALNTPAYEALSSIFPSLRVEITDFDGDTDSESRSDGIDGIGIFDDDAVDSI